MHQELEKHIINFLFIISFLIGTSSVTLSFVLAKKSDDQRYQSLLAFVASFFLYLATDFVFFYRRYFLLDWKMNTASMFLFYSTVVILLCFWLRLMGQIADIKASYKDQIYRGIGIAYMLVKLIIVLFFMDSDYLMSQFEAKILAINSDIVLFVFSLWCCCSYMVKGIKTATKGGVLVLGSAMILFILWSLLKELNIIFYPFGIYLFSVFPFDPIIVMYTLLNLLIVAYLYRKGLLFQVVESGQPVFTTVNETDQPTLEEFWSKYHLTNRERDILPLIYQGHNYAKIAEILGISLSTVRIHIDHIFKKVSVNSRAELIHLLTSSK